MTVTPPQEVGVNPGPRVGIARGLAYDDAEQASLRSLEEEKLPPGNLQT